MSEESGKAQGTKLAVAVVALVVAVVLLSWHFGVFESETVYPGSERQWFMDLGTGELLLVEKEDEMSFIPPIAPSSGATMDNGEPGGVLAFVFSCGNCSVPEERYVGYVLRYPLKEREALAQRPPYNQVMDPAFQEVAAVPATGDVSDLTWVGYESPQGRQVVQQAQTRCPQGEATPCYPE